MGKHTTVTREAVDHISQRTNLPRSIVRDMLWHGWTYSETINEPAAWISPDAQFIDKKVTGEI
jgi:hypothetical protein